MITDSELMKLLNAAEAATPGPWGLHGVTMSYHIARLEGEYHCSPRVVHATLGKNVYDPDNIEDGAGGVRKYADAQYIALADPTTIKALIEELIMARIATNS